MDTQTKEVFAEKANEQPPQTGVASRKPFFDGQAILKVFQAHPFRKVGTGGTRNNQALSGFGFHRIAR